MISLVRAGAIPTLLEPGITTSSGIQLGTSLVTVLIRELKIGLDIGDRFLRCSKLNLELLHFSLRLRCGVLPSYTDKDDIKTKKKKNAKKRSDCGTCLGPS